VRYNKLIGPDGCPESTRLVRETGVSRLSRCLGSMHDELTGRGSVADGGSSERGSSDSLPCAVGVAE
jgi:hypothetical protein